MLRKEEYRKLYATTTILFCGASMYECYMRTNKMQHTFLVRLIQARISSKDTTTNAFSNEKKKKTWSRKISLSIWVFHVWLFAHLLYCKWLFICFRRCVLSLSLICRCYQVVWEILSWFFFIFFFVSVSNVTHSLWEICTERVIQPHQRFTHNVWSLI